MKIVRTISLTDYVSQKLLEGIEKYQERKIFLFNEIQDSILYFPMDSNKLFHGFVIRVRQRRMMPRADIDVIREELTELESSITVGIYDHRVALLRITSEITIKSYTYIIGEIDADFLRVLKANNFSITLSNEYNL